MEYGTKLEHYSTPRIIVISDGEASDPKECETQLERAIENHIIIDCIALLSEDEGGKEALKRIAESTIGYPFGATEASERGQFILPKDIQSFFNKLTVLANKKVVTKQEDTILCLDISGSMKHPYKGSQITKINALKEAVDIFIDYKKKDPRDRIAVVTCGGYWAKTLIKLTTDKGAIMEVLKTQEPFGGSPLGGALKQAIDILDWKARAESFNYEEGIPIHDFSVIPKDTNSMYCEVIKGSNPKMDADSFSLRTGKYSFGAWQCPKCKSFFHGFCFTGKGFTNGENGICYKCGTPLKVPLNVK